MTIGNAYGREKCEGADFKNYSSTTSAGQLTTGRERENRIPTRTAKSSGSNFVAAL